MLLLPGTSDVLRIVTTTTAPIDVYAAFTDVGPSPADTVDGGRQLTAITSAATSTIVAAPATDLRRSVKTITARNKHASTANVVCIECYDGTNAFELVKVSLGAGESLHYHDGAGFFVHDNQGRLKNNDSANGANAAVNQLNMVVLASNVVNNNATANTMADVTGLSFAVTAGETYWFSFQIIYQAAATTTGSRWAINGPASPSMLAYTADNTLTATTLTLGNNSAYDLPAAANATSLIGTALAGNLARIDGFITPSADGTVVARFASEISGSAITARAGSLLQWVRTL